MWSWFKDNAFLAAWLALPIALLAGFRPSRGKKLKDVDWRRVFVYTIFAVALGLAAINSEARGVAAFVLGAAWVYIINDRPSAK